MYYNNERTYKIAIIADRYWTAEEMAQRNQLPASEWFYVRTMDQVRRLVYATIWYCDDFDRIPVRIIARAVRNGCVFMAGAYSRPAQFAEKHRMIKEALCTSIQNPLRPRIRSGSSSPSHRVVSYSHRTIPSGVFGRKKATP